jgi:hypothetical protein
MLILRLNQAGGLSWAQYDQSYKSISPTERNRKTYQLIHRIISEFMIHHKHHSHCPFEGGDLSGDNTSAVPLHEVEPIQTLGADLTILAILMDPPLSRMGPNAC